MSAIEDKVRRRLAPFVVEGKIGSPRFSAADAPRVTVSVQLKSSHARSRDVETALFAAVQDLGAEAQLVITGA
ncbi:MAG: hypothetical protein KDJ25_13945 [Rhodoblastus sp.]|nr:hypothetical protein [Rhodoblastus sp.]